MTLEYSVSRDPNKLQAAGQDNAATGGAGDFKVGDEEQRNKIEAQLKENGAQ